MRLSSNSVLHDIVSPCLVYLGIYNKRLALFLTALQNSDTLNNQKTFGAYEISHEQHWGLWDSYLANFPELASKIRGMASQHRFLDDPDQELIYNSGYATAIAATLLQQAAQQNDLGSLAMPELTRLWQSINPNIDAKSLLKDAERLQRQLQKTAA